MTAPLDKRSKEACVADLRASVEALLAAWDALPEDRLEEKIVTPNGESTPISMASLAATHMMYHDAQLNYIQAFHGDEAVHWD